MEAVPITIIVGAPILSAMGFKFAFVENILIRLFMLIALVYAIRFANPASGPLFSLLVFLAIITLLLERNHYVVSSLPNQKSSAVIPGPKNLYPIKAGHTTVAHVDLHIDEHVENDQTVDYTDNIPDLKEGPSNHDSPNYYKSLGLA